MIPMVRAAEPTFLTVKKKEWTDDYISNENKKFHWHAKHDELLRELKSMTNHHCAFCDDVLYPKSGPSPEIEHFKPKNKYKELAFDWANLYPICSHCNKTKNERFDDLLLRPDESGYQYSDWFRFNYITFELEPIKLGNSNWMRAAMNVSIYGLNKPDKLTRRANVLAEIADNKYSSKDFQPFRFL
jgi:hypothetical protein